MPELGKQIQGERHITSNNRVIRISAGSNNRESTVIRNRNKIEGEKFFIARLEISPTFYADDK